MQAGREVETKWRRENNDVAVDGGVVQGSGGESEASEKGSGDEEEEEEGGEEGEEEHGGRWPKRSANAMRCVENICLERFGIRELEELDEYRSGVTHLVGG